MHRVLRAVVLMVTTVAVPSQAAHRHGEVALQVVLEASTLSIELRAPGEALLGFERLPKDAQERAALAAVLADLRKPRAWLHIDAPAGCSLTAATVAAPGFTAERHEHEHEHAQAHAEIHASYRYQCRAPVNVQRLRLDLLPRYRQVERLRVDMVLPDRQANVVISPHDDLVLRP